MPEETVLEAPPAAAPASTSPPPQPSSNPKNTALENFDKTFDALEHPAPPEPKPVEQPPPKSAEKLAEKPTEKPAEAPKPEDVPGDEAEPTSPNLINTRNWGRRMAKGFSQARAEIKTLRQQMQEHQGKTAQPAEVSALAEQLKSAQARADKLENDLRLSSYERSEDYAKNFQQPWQEAENELSREIGQYRVYEPNPEFPDDPSQRIKRPATRRDFDEVYNAERGDAMELAEKKFGPIQAAEIMSHYRRIHELSAKAWRAIQDNKEKGNQHHQQTLAQQAQEREMGQKYWEQANSTLLEKQADVFGEREGDKEWNEALGKGREVADLKFTGDTYGKMPIDKRVRLDALVYHRASAFPALQVALTKANAALAAANKTIEEMRSSGPGKPAVFGKAPDGQSKGWEAEFDEKVPRL
jgi:hypothetical protein